jgi:ribose 5-phosphate isomerase A
MKELVAEELAKRVIHQQVLGVGTGSTVALAIERIGRRVRDESLHVRAVPTSLQTAWLCEQHGIEVLSSGYRGPIAWGFDGADAVDPKFLMIKGKGGALLQEKILAARCTEFVVIVDESKCVPTLAGIPIPIEVIPEAVGLVERSLSAMQACTAFKVRPCEGGKHGPIITEAGNVIIDAIFSSVEASLEIGLKSLVGVVETGLFTAVGSELMIGRKDKVETRRR